MNIQDEMQKIHHKYGVSEMANYEIEKFVEKLIEDDRAEQLKLHLVSDCCKQIDNLELTNNWGVRRCKECGSLVNTSGR